MVVKARVDDLARAIDEDSELLSAKRREIYEAETAATNSDREVSLLAAVYGTLSAQLQEAMIALVETLNPISVIDEPLVGQDTSPWPSRNLALAAFTGLISGISHAFVVEYIERLRGQGRNQASTVCSQGTRPQL